MSEEQLERLQRYLSQELSDEERTAFEQELAADAELRRELEAYRQAVAVVQAAGREKLKAQLAEKGRQLDARQNKSWLVYVGWATLGLLAALLGWWWLMKRPDTTRPLDANTNKTQLKDTISPTETPPPMAPPVQPPPAAEAERPATNSSQQIFAEWFSPYRDESLEYAVRGDVDPTPLELFLQHYWAEEYRLALVAFDSLDQSSNISDNNWFLYANCLMVSGKSQAAQPVLERIIARDKNRFRAHVPWYLAMSLLAQNQKTAAQIQLQQIANDPTSMYSDKATRLLLQLK